MENLSIKRQSQLSALCVKEAFKQNWNCQENGGHVTSVYCPRSSSSAICDHQQRKNRCSFGIKSFHRDLQPQSRVVDEVNLGARVKCTSICALDLNQRCVRTRQRPQHRIVRRDSDREKNKEKKLFERKNKKVCLCFKYFILILICAENRNLIFQITGDQASFCSSFSLRRSWWRRRRG